MPQPRLRPARQPRDRVPMPDYIAAMPGAEARERLSSTYGVLRNPTLSPGEKVTLLVVIDEYERKGLKHSEPMLIDEEELSRLVGYDVEGDD